MTAGAHRLRIATRESPLALWQAEHVRERLQALHPALDIDLVPMTTRGDQMLQTALNAVGGKGLFVKELEQAMLDGRADIAVHSMKDMPAEQPDGLTLAAFLASEDPRDAMVSPRHSSLAALPQGARVGTSSLRRSAQLRALRPDIEILTLRGNVGTRLRKLDEGEYDAILLACAGLRRLQLADRIQQALSVEQFIPAAGQGIIGIECRRDDQRTLKIIAALHDRESACRLQAERALTARLGGSCQVPIGAHAQCAANQMQLSAVVAQPDGGRQLRAKVSGASSQARSLGQQLAQRLIDDGAAEILAPLGVKL